MKQISDEEWEGIEAANEEIRMWRMRFLGYPKNDSIEATYFLSTPSIIMMRQSPEKYYEKLHKYPPPPNESF